jgi:CheY-like chemotaxis protein
MKIMIVDDSSSVRASAEDDPRMPMQCQLVECADGEEALAEYPRTRPDLVLMDIEMPVMDGIAAAEQLLGS